MQKLIDKARVLIEALPYIKQFRGRRVVVKIGGAALEDLTLRERFVEDLVLLRWVGIEVVVVHGGGKQITQMLDRLGLEARFVDGMRVTDRATLEVVEMVLGGALNQELVRLVNRLGGRAVGLTGKDGSLARAERQTDPDLGLVGRITGIDTAVIDRLVPEFIPIIAPLAMDQEGAGALNINADVFAAHLAQALGAEKLVLLTDVVGVRGEGGQLLPSITARHARELIAAKIITGGMIPKIEYALAALDAGVRKVHIIDGRLEHALLLEIFTADGVGTQVIQESSRAPARSTGESQ